MANYKNTSAPGESRRRAYKISIYNPADTNDETSGRPKQILKAIFEMEDKINMADGSSILVPAGEMVVLLDESTLSTKYAAVDIATGEINIENTRTGLEIMRSIMDGLEDVFVNEGMKRDTLLDYTPPVPPMYERPILPPVNLSLIHI